MYDVIVAGAGPAGNMAALRLTEMGFKVLVVDWRQEIGDKLCTGIIGNECVDKYPPDESYIHHKASSATVVSPGGVRYDVSRQEPQAYIVDRVAYVKSFAEAAIESGAEYRLGPRITGVRISKQGVQVTTTEESKTFTDEAQTFVIASGFGSPLLRMAGLQNDKDQEFMIGCQATVECSELAHTEVYVGESVVPGSFGWIVPTYTGAALVGLLPTSKTRPDMQSFLSTLEGLGKVRGTIRETQQWGIPLRPMSRTYGERVLAVGDAAGLVKPTTGGGIYYAMRSGELAAESLREAFERVDFSARQFRGYERNWKALLGKELRVGYYARAIYESLNDHQIEHLMSEFFSDKIQNELINSSDFSFDWHSKVILKAISYRNLGVALGSFGPVVSTLIKRLR